MMYTPEISDDYRYYLRGVAPSRKALTEYACIADRVMMRNERDEIETGDLQSLALSICDTDEPKQRTLNHYAVGIRLLKEYLQEVRV